MSNAYNLSEVELLTWRHTHYWIRRIGRFGARS